MAFDLQNGSRKEMKLKKYQKIVGEKNESKYTNDIRFAIKVALLTLTWINAYKHKEVLSGYSVLLYFSLFLKQWMKLVKCFSS